MSIWAKKKTCFWPRVLAINILPIQFVSTTNEEMPFLNFFLPMSSFFPCKTSEGKTEQILRRNNKVSTNAERQKSAFLNPIIGENLFEKLLPEGPQTNDGAAMPCNHKASVSQVVKCLRV